MNPDLREHAVRTLGEAASKVRELAESMIADYQSSLFLDPRDFGIGDTPGFLPANPGSTPVWLDRRKKGEFIPAFLTESQLTWLRRRLRALVVQNEIAQAVIQARQSYVVGKGFKYKVTPRSPKCPAALVATVQGIVDVFADFNQLPYRESETLARLDGEGEAILRFFPTSGGILAIRFVENDMLRSPHGDDSSAENSFGVQTRKLDVEDVQGYWIVQGLPDENPVSTLVAAEEVLHIKYPETPSFSKRGLSPFFSIETNLRFAEELLSSTVALAKNRAKIAMIRKLHNTVASAAQALLDNQADVKTTDPATLNSDVTLEKYRYGTVLTVPATSEYEFPDAGVGASDHVAVYQMVLRSIGARFNMPEYLISSDASNGNFASTLVAEAPFVKSIERLQDYLGYHFAGRRYGQRSVVWRQIAHSVKCGLLPPDVFALIDVQVEPPSLVVRDPLQQAQVDKIYNEMGVKSKTTIQMQLDLDPKQEAQHIAAEKPPEPPPPPPGTNLSPQGPPNQPPPGVPARDPLHPKPGAVTG